MSHPAAAERVSLRQAMAWLHTWSGLVLGWLMFAIFLTGSLSFYRQEISLWMRPELQAGYSPGHQPSRQALLAAQRAAAQAPQYGLAAGFDELYDVGVEADGGHGQDDEKFAEFLQRQEKRFRDAGAGRDGGDH